MKAKAPKAALAYLAGFGPSVFALCVLAFVSLRSGGLEVLMRGGPSAALIAISIGYVVISFVRKRMISVAFGFLCVACGAYIAWYSPANWPAGLLAAAAGLLAIAKEYL